MAGCTERWAGRPQFSLQNEEAIHHPDGQEPERTDWQPVNQLRPVVTYFDQKRNVSRQQRAAQTCCDSGPGRELRLATQPESPG